MKEETGLDVVILEDFKISMEYKISETVKKEVILFLGRPTSTSVTIQESEIEMYRWAAFPDTLKLILFDSQKHILKKAHEFLNFNYKCFP